MTAPNSGAVGDARKREADRTEPGRLSHPDASVRALIREAQERAVNAALLPIRRYAEAAALTAKARGQLGLERAWLDLLILCDRAAATS